MQFTNEEIERRVVAYQDFPCEENEEAAVEAIQYIAEKMLTCYAAKFDLTYIRSDDVTCHALERLWHFDPAKGKGKAFNYFTTVIGCFIRQLVRREHDAATLRRKYQKYLGDKREAVEHAILTEVRESAIALAK